MKITKNMTLLSIIFLLESAIIAPHGFAENTPISIEHGTDSVSIQDISARFFRGQKTYVDSYKEKSEKWKSKPVQAVAYCQSSIYCQLTCTDAQNLSETIVCSPLQEFYRISDQQWVSADQLNQGDLLLCKNKNITQLQFKSYTAEQITFYIIEVKKYHTFTVGQQKILAHNMFIPAVATLGFSVPFDLIFSAGSLGFIFGPVTYCCSIAIAGIVAAVLYQCNKEKTSEFHLVAHGMNDYNGIDDYTNSSTINECHKIPFVKTTPTGCGGSGPSFTITTGCGSTTPISTPVTGCGSTIPISKPITGFDKLPPKTSYILTKSVEDKDSGSATTNQGAQAPGKPTEKDGFIPNKKWDGKKVRHKKGYG